VPDWLINILTIRIKSAVFKSKPVQQLAAQLFLKFDFSCRSYHGRPQGGQNEDFPPPLESGTKNQKFLENLR